MLVPCVPVGVGGLQLHDPRPRRHHHLQGPRQLKNSKVFFFRWNVVFEGRRYLFYVIQNMLVLVVRVSNKPGSGKKALFKDSRALCGHMSEEVSE